LSGNRIFAGRGLELLAGIFFHQSPDGFFLEYEGADPGYETLGLHYLAKLRSELELAGESDAARDLEAAVSRSLDFLSHFIHPDGSLGGEYGSRACPQVFPGGLEFWARRFSVAEASCRHVVRALAAQRAAGLRDSDIRNEIPLLSSNIWALQSLAAGGSAHPEPAMLPCQQAFDRIFPHAGLYVRSEPGRSFLVFGASKGGVI